MKKVGLVGGTGPESTVEYYQTIISKFQRKVGSKDTLPELAINSINMYRIFELLTNHQTDSLVQYLVEAVKGLERLGCDFAVLAANTPHVVFDQVQDHVHIPMISIVEETYRLADQLELKKIGLIGTRFTMEHDFFSKPFHANQKNIVTPIASERELIHAKTVDELEKGIVKENTKNEFLNIIARMIEEDGIDGIILGCTEFPMLIEENDLTIPSLNTTEIHINAIVEMILSD